jgi:hypothetical protein
MNPAPARRRPVTSLILGVLAMGGSFAVLGVLVLSDVAAAGEPSKQAPEKVAYAEPSKPVRLPETLSETDLLVAPELEEKPAPKKRSRKQVKVDFGRFEGY